MQMWIELSTWPIDSSGKVNFQHWCQNLPQQRKESTSILHPFTKTVLVTDLVFNSAIANAKYGVFHLSAILNPSWQYLACASGWAPLCISSSSSSSAKSPSKMKLPLFDSYFRACTEKSKGGTRIPGKAITLRPFEIWEVTNIHACHWKEGQPFAGQ